MGKKKITVLTGAGVSAESGITTFRDSDGLWENHKVEDVASIEGWYRNPKVVLDFYNARRAQLGSVRPNAAHEAIASLEKDVKLLYTAFDEAKRVLAEDPELANEENSALAKALKERLFKRQNVIV